ncbi:MAG: LysM peptidoglycan-binding domain-containing protein [bacterium]|nr:LysM peptidoglycan-binding domain-containing protein [bacterium]
MVDPKDRNREDFIINEHYAAEEAADLDREDYYERSSEVFRKKSIIPFVFGGLGLVVLVVLFVIVLSRPKNIVDQEYLQSLETRMQQLEKKLATIGVIDQTIEQLGKQEQNLNRIDKKTARFESTVTTQIDQIIKDLGALHQKISQISTTAAPQPKTADKKQPVASKKSDSNTQFHQVQAGETLYGISRRYGLSVEQLRTYNNLATNIAIYPGQKLKLNPKPKQ